MSQETKSKHKTAHNKPSFLLLCSMTNETSKATLVTIQAELVSMSPKEEKQARKMSVAKESSRRSPPTPAPTATPRNTANTTWLSWMVVMTNSYALLSNFLMIFNAARKHTHLKDILKHQDNLRVQAQIGAELPLLRWFTFMYILHSVAYVYILCNRKKASSYRLACWIGIFDIIRSWKQGKSKALETHLFCFILDILFLRLLVHETRNLQQSKRHLSSPSWKIKISPTKVEKERANKSWSEALAAIIFP